MHSLFEITFILYLLKLLAGNEFVVITASFNATVGKNFPSYMNMQFAKILGGQPPKTNPTGSPPLSF